jgi:hypothetical protein
MIDYSARVVGDTRVALRFDRFPDLAHNALREKMETLTEVLHGDVETLVPRGATGRLAAQVKSGVQDDPNRIRGWVSLAGDAALARQAAALEYGSRSTKFSVKSYTRTLDQAFGKLTEPFDQVVEAYRRAGGLEAVEFLRGPLREDAPGALAELNAAVERATKESD